MKHWPYAAATLMLIATLAVARTDRSGEAAPVRPLQALSLVLGPWQGRELPMRERDLEILKLDDHISRVYRDTEGPGSTLAVLYIGYYQSQRTGATYHSPLNCLPGSGWQISEARELSLPGSPDIRLKTLTIERELQRQVVLYWYHDRGRAIPSEFAAKAWLVWDALRYNRTDGALVRITVPVSTSTEAASQDALRFLTALWPALVERLPPPSRS